MFSCTASLRSSGASEWTHAVGGAAGTHLRDEAQIVGVGVERLLDDLVGDERPVEVTGVDVRDAEGDGLAQHGDRGVAIGGRAEDAGPGQLHRAVAHPAERQAVGGGDAAATKELLLRAAVDEFAEHGLSGARIDRIAERAGANKRLLYVYFGNKEDLFDAVVSRHVNELNEAIPFDAADLAGHAGRVFDYMLENPHVMRLVTWRDFEREAPTPAEEAAYARKLAAVRAAQRAGLVNDGLPAVDVLAITQRMATSWLAAPIGLRAAAGKDPLSARRLRQHRTALVEAVRRVTAPG
jgi:AcrR family transcriptional regulator